MKLDRDMAIAHLSLNGWVPVAHGLTGYEIDFGVHHAEYGTVLSGVLNEVVTYGVSHFPKGIQGIAECAWDDLSDAALKAVIPKACRVGNCLLTSVNRVDSSLPQPSTKDDS